MALELKRFPEFGVELHIRSGAFTSEDLIRYFRSLGPADALRCWIFYYDETAETSGLDLGHLPELKRTITAKKKELFGDGAPRAAVVCGPGANREFFEFWTRLLASGERPSIAPQLFPTLRAACEGLGVPDAACEALERAVAAPQGDGGRLAAGPDAAPPPQT